jgi:excisionase family DNA binding protein
MAEANATVSVDNLAQLNRALTVSEAARVLGVHKLTLYRYIRQGRIPALRIGTCVRLNPKALAEYVGAGE